VSAMQGMAVGMEMQATSQLIKVYPTGLSLSELKENHFKKIIRLVYGDRDS